MVCTVWSKSIATKYVIFDLLGLWKDGEEGRMQVKEIELYIYCTEAKAPAKAPAKTEHMSVLTRGYHGTMRDEKVTIGLGRRWAGALQSSITQSLKSYEEEIRGES